MILVKFPIDNIVSLLLEAVLRTYIYVHASSALIIDIVRGQKKPDSTLHKIWEIAIIQK